MPEPRGPRVRTLIGLGLGGLVLGFVGAVLVSLHRVVLGVDVPWGLLLALLTLVFGARAAAWLVGSRRGAAAVLVGWVLPSLAYSSVNPGGDVLLPDEPRSYVYLAGGLFLGLLATVWPLPAGAAELAAQHAHKHRGADAGADVGADAAVDAYAPGDGVTAGLASDIAEPAVGGGHPDDPSPSSGVGS